MLTKRSEDILLLTYQDNIKKEIIIYSTNEYADYFLKYTKEELIGKSFFDILSPHTKTIILDNTFFDNDNDLLNILIKINNFSVQDKLGIIHEVQQKIFRIMSPNENRINYEILMRDISISKKLEIFRNKSFSNKKYELDPDLNVIDKKSSPIEIQLILDFIKINHINAVIGIIMIDSELTNISYCKVIIDLIYLNIRSDDIVGYLGNNKIFITLMKCSNADGLKVMSRLHKVFTEFTYNTTSLKIYMVYSLLNKYSNSQELLEKSNLILSKLESNIQNTILEV